MKKFATYDEKTFELISIADGRLDPLETEKAGHNIYLVPAHSTDVLPGYTPENHVARWNGTSWDILEDHRNNPATGSGGTEYWLPGDKWSDQPRVMTELGSLPEDAMLTPPSKSEEEIFTDNANTIRSERDRRIAKTDYLTTNDYPINREDLMNVNVYRQKLRDIPQHPDFPWDGDINNPNIPWPIMPEIHILKNY